MSNVIFEKLLDVTEKSLDLRVNRQNILASNIANQDTPNFTPVDISFENELKQHLENDEKAEILKTNEKHFENIQNIEDENGELFFDPSHSPNNDKNTVNIDREMSKLSINSVLYNAQTTVLNKKLALLKYAATDGNK